MNVKVYDSQYVSFIDALNKKRSSFDKMLAIVLRAHNNDNETKIQAKSEIDEVVQVLQFHFNGKEAIMLTNVEHKRIFLVLKKDNSTALTILEKAIEREFGEGRIEFELSASIYKGLEKMCALLLECIGEDDVTSSMCVKRLARPTNTYAIVSNDKDMQNRLAKILQSSGNVMLFKNIENILDDYNKYAPEVVFIHDKEIKDFQSRSKLHHLLNIKDPLGYSVIVSNLPDAKFVMDCKKGRY